MSKETRAPSRLLFWGYEAGSKTKGAHAFVEVAGPSARPLCGRPFVQLYMRPLEKAAKKRVYSIGKCPDCLEKARRFELEKQGCSHGPETGCVIREGERGA